MLEITIIGNIGRDAEIKDINGQKKITFSVAHSHSYTNNEGVKVERTTWISCFKPSNDNSSLASYLKKGTKVFIRGTLSVSIYSDHNNVNHPDIKCDVRTIELLSSSKSKQEDSCPY